MARAERLGEATKLTEDMLDRGLHPYPRVLRFMLGRLATAGEVDVLQRFENKLTPVRSWSRFMLINFGISSSKQ